MLPFDRIKVFVSPLILLISSISSFKFGYKVGSPFAVKLSLDCVSEKCFKKLDRVNKNVEIEKIIPSMVNFSIETKNDFVLEILFVKDLNDKEDEIVLLYDAVKKINPKRVDIGTIDRPPAYDVKPVSYEFLESVADRFENINTNIIYKNRPKSIQYYDKDEIKSMLKRRPLTKEDIQNMFDEESKLILNDLLENKFISLVNSSGVEFYKNLQK